jgi:hypothetical protein
MDDPRNEQVLPPDSIEPSCGRCDAGWLWSGARGNHLCDCEHGERAGEVEADHATALLMNLAWDMRPRVAA